MFKGCVSNQSTDHTDISEAGYKWLKSQQACGAVCLLACLLYRYSVVKRADNSQMLLLAAERTASLASLLGTELETVGTFTGNVSTHHAASELTPCSPCCD